MHSMAALSLLLIAVAAIGAAWASPVHVPALPYDALRGDDDAMRNDEAAQLVFAAQPPQLMSHDYSLHSASESAMAGKDAAVAAAGAVNNAVTGTTGSTGANDASPSLVRPFSPVDMVSLDRLGSLAVSPDGKRAVFTRWHYTPSSNQKSKSLWAVDLKDDGGRASVPLMDEAYPLTPAVDGVTDDEPVWTGGDEVVFLRSDPRKKTTAKVAQFHRLVVSEARVSLSEARVSSAVDVAVEMYPEHPLPLGVGNLKYSASGKYLTFTAEVYANEHSSMVDTAARDTLKAKDASSALVFDKTYFRHWDTYDNHKNSHLFLLPIHDKTVVDPAASAVNVMRGERRFSCPVPPHGDASGYALAADGKELAFATMEKFDKAEQAWSTNVNIYTLVLEKDGTFGAPRCVTCENHGANTHPVYSPDGSKLAYLEMRTPTYEADKNRLMVVDRASGRKTDLTRDWDRSVDDFVWTEDSSTLIASVGEHGRTKIFTINASTGKQELLVGENSNTGLAVVPGTNLVAFGKNSLSYPTEYYTVDWHTGALAQRTSIHAAYMSSITTSPAEDFWFEGALGDQVMGWFVKPANFDPARKYPLAFLIHGGPQSAWMDSFSTRWNMQAFAGAGYAVAVVNFHGSNTYGQNFTDSINKEWGSHPFEDLMKGLDDILARNPWIDPKRVAGLGASYGGYMINWVNGHTDRFACLVNHDGLFDLRSMYYGTEELYFPEFEFGGTPYQQPEMYAKWSPSTFVQNWKTPTLVIHGGKDYRVPQGEGFSTFTALQRMGIESRLVFFPDENHWVLKPANSLRWHEEVLRWIGKFTAK